MIPNTAFSPSVSLVHKWANAVAAEMRALHWGAERVSFMLFVGACAVYAAELACSYFLEREGGRREEGGGMMLCFALGRYSQELA